ncbi:MAG: hypothetical protein J6P61_03090 [Erysipelotrichaceae bacterium]|nr:hypothetical protein [Erysipelotrichaceae bacterium]
MDYAGVALLLGLFISNAVGLDLLYNHRLKLAGTLNIVNLCLTIALAYNFNQIRSILIVFAVVAVIVVIILLARLYINFKRRQNRPSQPFEPPVDVDFIEHEDEE